jgi:hypothetical protein
MEFEVSKCSCHLLQGGTEFAKGGHGAYKKRTSFLQVGTEFAKGGHGAYKKRISIILCS